MKVRHLEFILTSLLITISPMIVSAQTGTKTTTAPDDITQWTNKTIMWFGPHQDDESSSLGTLSLLKANGNKIIMVWYTTGNKGSRDLEMTSERLAQIRKIETEKALLIQPFTQNLMENHLVILHWNSA